MVKEYFYVPKYTLSHQTNELYVYILRVNENTKDFYRLCYYISYLFLRSVS